MAKRSVTIGCLRLSVSGTVLRLSVRCAYHRGLRRPQSSSWLWRRRGCCVFEAAGQVSGSLLSTCLLVSRLGNQPFPPFPGADDLRTQGASTGVVAHVRRKFRHPLTLSRRRYRFGHGGESDHVRDLEFLGGREAPETVAGATDMAKSASKSVAVTGCAY